jgi:hypothetical protein
MTFLRMTPLQEFSMAQWHIDHSLDSRNSDFAVTDDAAHKTQVFRKIDLVGRRPRTLRSRSRSRDSPVLLLSADGNGIERRVSDRCAAFLLLWMNPKIGTSRMETRIAELLRNCLKPVAGRPDMEVDVLATRKIRNGGRLTSRRNEESRVSRCRFLFERRST